MKKQIPLLNNIADYNIEYAHIYSSDIINGLDKIKNNIDKTLPIIKLLKHQGYSIALSVLVDDYSCDQEKIEPEFIHDLFSKCGLSPDHVIMESELTKNAQYFLNMLPDKYLFKHDNKTIYQSENQDIHFSDLLVKTRRYKTIFLEKNTINSDYSKKHKPNELLSFNQQRCHSNSDLVLYVENGEECRYSCPLLAACWYLARLGVNPFYSSIFNSLKKDKLFIGKSLLTILPIDFIKVEATATELIGLSKTKRINKCKKKIEYYFIK